MLLAACYCTPLSALQPAAMCASAAVLYPHPFQSELEALPSMYPAHAVAAPAPQAALPLESTPLSWVDTPEALEVSLGCSDGVHE